MIGTLVELSDSELKQVMSGTHHFCYLSLVMSEILTSTTARLINNTKAQVPGKGTSYCLKNQMVKTHIGDSYDSLMDFSLFNHPYSSDISKCYLGILVDSLTAKLRLLIWFKDPLQMTGMMAFQRPTMDFGDTCSSLVIRIVQEKYLSQTCKLKLTKHLIIYGAYADNYSSSFKSKQLFRQVKEDMESTHQKIEFPLKCTYTSVNTDDKILDELGMTEKDQPVYNFLGLQWDMKENTLNPNSYFALGKRKAGLKSGSVSEYAEDDDSFLLEEKVTRRLLSCLCAQSYVRLGVLMSCMSIGLRILTSRSCELADISVLDLDLNLRDPDFVQVAKKFLKKSKTGQYCSTFTSRDD